MQPFEPEQGALGSRFFTRALDWLLFRPKQLQSVFVKYNVETGIYAALFRVNGRWRCVVVDDLLPCTASGQPLFATNTDKSQLWVPILEKCYAKLHRCYQNIDGGIEPYALCDVAGATHKAVELSEPHAQAMASSGKLWEVLLEGQNEGYLFTCALAKNPNDYESTKGGLAKGRTYFINKVVELDNVRLVQIVSPDDKDVWTGRWSDKHPIWGEYPDFRQRLGYSEGTANPFWMEYFDFITCWSRVDVYHVIPQDWYTYTLYGMWDLGFMESDDTCGGEEAWYQNPQYFLWVKETTKVVIELHQPDTKMYEGEDEYFVEIGARICMSTTQGEPRITRNASVTHLQIPCQGERSVSGEVTLEPHTDLPYAIAVYTKEPKSILPFCLTIYSSRPVTLEGDTNRQGLFARELERGPAPATYVDIFEEWYFEGREHMLIGVDTGKLITKKEPSFAPVQLGPQKELSFSFTKNRQAVLRLVNMRVHDAVKALSPTAPPPPHRASRLPKYANANHGRYMAVLQEVCARRVGLSIFGASDLKPKMKTYGSKRAPPEGAALHQCAAGVCIFFAPGGRGGTWETLTVVDGDASPQPVPQVFTATPSQPQIAAPTMDAVLSFCERVCGRPRAHILRVECTCTPIYLTWKTVDSFEDLFVCNGRPRLDLRISFKVPGCPSDFTLAATEGLAGVFKFTVPTSNGYTISKFKLVLVNIAKPLEPIESEVPYGGAPGAVSLRVTGLRANRRYACSVAAGNEVGWGAATDPVALATSIMDQNLVHQFDAHKGAVTCLAMDEHTLYSGSRDWLVRAWRRPDFSMLREFAGHAGAIYAIALFGSHLYSASEDRSVRHWDTETGACLGVLEGHKAPVMCLHCPPSTQLVFSGSCDATLGVWNPLDADPPRFIRCASAVFSLCSSGAVLYVGMSNGTISAVDMRKFECLCTYTLHSGTVSCVCATDDCLVSGSYDCTVRIWHKQSGQCLASFKAHRGPVYTVVLHNNAYIFTTSWDGTAAAFELASRRCLHRFTLLSGPIQCLASDGESLYAGSAEGRVHVLKIPDLTKAEDQQTEQPEVSLVSL
eukprot:TRINITY_DN5082_c0_g1_i3.p1 TRINITY_DN5082_c0_g1~~TRINITY_DN5082_c0_g1_i3.p1  ORF type:complete len:1205 (+),score=236.39 TRINITY_DN5082_c0_g1_i3:420-3617(+)